MEQPIVSPEMYARIQAAAKDLEHAMKKAHLTPRQIQDVSVGMQEYFTAMQQIVSAEEANKAAPASVQPAGEPKTGWTEEDIKPFLDAGAKRLK